MILLVCLLIDLIEKTHIIFPSQHGFRAGHPPLCPYNARQIMVSETILHRHYPGFGKSIFYRKSRNSPSKIIHLRDQRNPIRLVCQLFDNRLQCVTCNVLSDLTIVKHGVPRGLNLGPLFFLLLNNDLPNVSDILSFILFTDDTNIFCSHSSMSR